MRRKLSPFVKFAVDLNITAKSSTEPVTQAQTHQLIKKGDTEKEGEPQPAFSNASGGALEHDDDGDVECGVCKTDTDQATPNNDT